MREGALGEMLLLLLGSIPILLLPGFAVLVLLPSRPRGPGLWAYAFALSIALNAILFELADLVGIGITRTGLVVIAFWLLGVILLKLLGWIYERGVLPIRHLWRRPEVWTWILPGIVFIAFLFRWIPLAGVEVLPGIDSNQHASISQLFVSTGGIPDDYGAYAPLSTFSYHFGLHANAAALSMLTDVPVHRVLVYLEPLLMAVLTAAVYVLTAHLTGRPFVALGAAVITAFAGAFPAWYVNWARLPQLAGSVLVTIGLAELVREERETPSVKVLLLGALAAGLFLTHYRMVVVFVYGAVAWVLWLTASREARPRLGRELTGGFAAALMTFLLTLPWTIHVIESFDFAQTGSRGLGAELPPRFFYSVSRVGNIVSLPTTPWLVALLVLGLGVMLVRSRRHLVLPLVWMTLLVAFSNPYLLRLPWSGAVDFVTVVSLSFIPGAILAAYGLSLLAMPPFFHGPPGTSPRPLRQAICIGGVAAVAIVGMVQTADVRQPWTTFVSEADLRAFEWIETSTSPDAVFLTNMLVSRVDIVEPTDGGVWITYFTGRRQTAPPLVYSIERGSAAAYETRLKRLVALERRIRRPETVDELRRFGITHVYSGSRFPVMNPQALSRNDQLRLVYKIRGVEIFELIDG